MSRTKCPSCETRYNRPATTVGDHCMVCKGGIIVRDNDELTLRLEELSQLSLKMEDILSDIGDFDPDEITDDLKGDVEAITVKIQDCLDAIGLTQVGGSDESYADKHWTYVLGSRTKRDENGSRMFWKNDTRDPGWASFEALDDGDIYESMSENSEDGIWMTLAVAQEEFNRDTTCHKKDCMCSQCDPKANKLYAALTGPDEHDNDCYCDKCDPLHEKLLESVVGPDSPMLLRNMGQDDDEEKDHCTLDLNDLYDPDKTDEPDQELSSESHL